MTAPRIDPPDGGGCELARQAMLRATDALDGHREVYEALGALTREVAGLRTEIREGMRVLGIRLRDTRREARAALDSVSDLEDTQTRELKAEVASLRKSSRWWRNWLLSVVAGIVIGVAVALIQTWLAHK